MSCATIPVCHNPAFQRLLRVLTSASMGGAALADMPGPVHVHSTVNGQQCPASFRTRRTRPHVPVLGWERPKRPHPFKVYCHGHGQYQPPGGCTPASPDGGTKDLAWLDRCPSLLGILGATRRDKSVPCQGGVDPGPKYQPPGGALNGACRSPACRPRSLPPGGGHLQGSDGAPFLGAVHVRSESPTSFPPTLRL